MKLCSICDKKIEGTWCKNCKRFVKVYDVSNDMYLNESHDPKNDVGCTYHTPMTTTRTTASTGTSRANSGTNTHRTTATQTTRTTTSTATTPAKKSKAGKIIAIIVGIYVVLALLSSVVPLLMNGFIKDMFSEAFEKEKEEYEVEVDVDIPGISIPEPDVSVASIFLSSVKPVDTEVYEEGGITYEYSYYDPETIAITGVSCDGAHLTIEIEELDDLLEQYFPDTENWYTEEEAIPENNYLMEYDGASRAYFETDRYYELSESLMISVDYDTASGKLHGILFAADAYETETEDYYAIYHALLQQLDSEYDGSKLSLARKIEREIQDAEETYGSVEVSDVVEILVSKDEYGHIIVAYYPFYE